MRGKREVRRTGNGALPAAIGALSAAAVAAILALSLAACQDPPADLYVGGSLGGTASAIAVGDDAVGEPCRYRPLAGQDFAVGATRSFALYCGKWRQPSARIFELGPGNDIRAAANAGSWRTYLDPRFACGAPVATTILDRAPAMLMQCTRRNGGWPQLALTTTMGGRVFAADAVPAALPPVETAIAALAGQRNPSAGRPPSEAARLIARGRTGRPFGAGDLQGFYDLMAAGDAYNNIDDAAAAEQSFREALAIQQRFLGTDDPGLAPTMMKLAAQISHQRSAPEADRLLAQAATLAARANDPLVLAELDYYRAVTAAYEAKPRDAETWARKAEQRFSALLPPGIGENLRPDITDVSLRAHGVDVAVLTADSARPPTEDTAILGLAETLRLRAVLAAKTGDAAASTALALRADRLLAATGLGVSSTGARSLRLVAENEAGGTHYAAAGGYGADAGQVFERVVPGERPQALNLLKNGDYLLRRGQTDASLALFRKAGEILRRPGVVGVPPEAILPWLDALQQAAQAPGADRAKLEAQMFAAAQLGIGSLTAQDIARSTARLAAANPQSAAAVRDYQNKERDFDTAEAERDVAVADRAPAETIAAIDKRIRDAQQARDRSESAILAAAPRYVEWSGKPASATAVRGKLAANEALISFFVSKRGSYGFVVRRDGILAYPIALTQGQLGSLVGRLRDSTVAQPGGLPSFDLAAAYQLYSALFGPAERDLGTVSALAIAASGDLLRFPLAALVTRPGITVANGDYRQVPWLLRRFALSYFPSPRVFANLRGERAGVPELRPFIGFGDFVPATRPQLAATFPPDRCHDDFARLQLLKPLPDTKTEVVTIADRLGGGPDDIVLGRGFTKSRLMTSDLAQYRVILLAAHALLPDDLKCQTEPSIVVSVPPRSANADPGFLRTSDIDRIKLDADLVVLSACSTAGPDARTGESLSGLARAFFLAGAHGLLVTHWTIVSGAAIPLMTGTFPGGGELGTAQALRRAQLHMIDTAGTGKNPVELSYPNYWAAFALVGDGVRGRGPGA